MAAAALVEVKKTGGWKSHRSGMKFDVFGNMVGNVFSEYIFPNIFPNIFPTIFPTIFPNTSNTLEHKRKRGLALRKSEITFS